MLELLRKIYTEVKEIRKELQTIRYGLEHGKCTKISKVPKQKLREILDEELYYAFVTNDFGTARRLLAFADKGRIIKTKEFVKLCTAIECLESKEMN